MAKGDYPYRWPQPALINIAMVSNATFTSWRTRNKLLPRPESDRKRAMYSTAEICVARAMVVLVNNGVAADRASSLAMQTLEFFTDVCEVDGKGMIANNIYFFSDETVRIADPSEELHSVTTDGADRPGECALMLNLGLILIHVMVGMQNWMGAKYKLVGGPPAKPHASYASLSADDTGGPQQPLPPHPMTRAVALERLADARNQLNDMIDVLQRLQEQGGTGASDAQ